MNIVVLGAPGAGKGTQSRNLGRHFNIRHISTGDILRNEVADKTEIGLVIKDDMKKGNLIDDGLVTDLLKREFVSVGGDGFIVDGYPRTFCQAETLSKLKEINFAVSVDVNDSCIVTRMSGRYVCSECGYVYHLVYYPPKDPNTCDKCGGKLIQRKDDKAHTVMNRLKIYHAATNPIINFYESLGILLRVRGDKEITEVTDDIIRLIEEKSG